MASLWSTANAIADNGLYHRCNRILERQPQVHYSLEYIKEETMRLVDQQTTKGHRHLSLIGGDLNSSETAGESGGGTSPPLAEWWCDSQLDNTNINFARHTPVMSRATKIRVVTPVMENVS